MKKIKNNKPWIPAQGCFCSCESQDKQYQWVSWGLVIYDIRRFVGMDQINFGRLISGYTRSQIARYESEQAEPPIDFWIRIMKVLGLNINWALTGKGKPYIEEFQESDERKKYINWEKIEDERLEYLKKLDK